MPRYKISIEFDGTRYSGWQKQPNSDTVEEEIESALSRILPQPVDVIGQGRTDSGVHAEEQIAHFDFPDELDADRILYALLGVLPHDIAVWDMQQVDDDFHARFDAVARRYRYQIIRRPAPLIRSVSEMVLDELDLDKMHHCAQKVQGTHNFDSFTKPDNQNPDSVCEVLHSSFTEDEYLLCYHVEANRFVRHMVRRLVGTMIEVGKGKRTVEKFEDMIDNASKRKNGHGAPAQGLVLEKVKFEKS
ncbi:tRNA pseudouridine(38-40) synthase TruA [Aliifodinibius salipaludis]|uniref:tRNA pseudouridine synthase A n=1 Tax=Fodinibius salipaludis TaxID=2032627 RepID=A0A2A2GGB8_9BACT|nr:tRNA pseudouridine(38-40) synthase TruA [Aliifodinibius salipaludis]PAU95822.1 tRNA pseudouridine(38-40) synthase TruA [Aliifodinibius salipaludis]